MRVVIAGSSGLIGTALRGRLAADGHDVVRLVRSQPEPGSNQLGWDPAAGTIDGAGLDGIDAAVNLAGVGIGDRRWSDAHKKAVLDSRVDSTRTLVSALTALDSKPEVLVNASAIGYYGDRGDEVLTEDSAPGEGFVADVCRAWEAAAEPAAQAGIRTVRIRTGLVLSPDGGIFPRMALPFRLGVGGVIGSGNQYWSWITIEDEVSAIMHLLESDVSGPVNLTAPDPAPMRRVVDVLGSVLRRPTFLKPPSFALKALLGSERAETLLMEGQRVVPQRLQQSGFQFAHPELEPALRHVLGKA